MKNVMGSVLSAVGTIIMFLFVFIGVIAGYRAWFFFYDVPMPAQQGFNWFIAVPIFISGGIIGLLFIGVSQVLHLLQRNAEVSEKILSNLKGKDENGIEEKIKEYL